MLMRVRQGQVGLWIVGSGKGFIVLPLVLPMNDIFFQKLFNGAPCVLALCACFTAPSIPKFTFEFISCFFHMSSLVSALTAFRPCRFTFSHPYGLLLPCRWWSRQTSFFSHGEFVVPGRNMHHTMGGIFLPVFLFFWSTHGLIAHFNPPCLLLDKKGICASTPTRLRTLRSMPA